MSSARVQLGDWLRDGEVGSSGSACAALGSEVETLGCASRSSAVCRGHRAGSGEVRLREFR